MSTNRYEMGIKELKMVEFHSPSNTLSLFHQAVKWLKENPQFFLHGVNYSCDEFGHHLSLYVQL